MARELKNANITFVSYVDKGANQKEFFLTKAAAVQLPTFQKEVKLVTKSDDPKQLVYGVVYEPDVEDSHGDFMTAEEIEKVAHTFIKEYRNIDTQHNFVAGVGEVVEFYVAPSDITVGDQIIKAGSWVLATKASDEIWEKIQKGEFTGYSMAGTAEAVEKSNIVKRILEGVQNILTGTSIQKGAVKDKYNKNAKSRGFWAAQDALIAVLQNWDDWDWTTSLEEDPEKIKEALQDFSDIVTDLLANDAADIIKAIGKPPESIAKAGKKISSTNMAHLEAAYEALATVIADAKGEEGEEDVVKAEDIAKAVTDALVPVVTRLEALEKGEKNDPAPDPTPDGGEDVAKMVADAVSAAVAPLADRLEAVEKARGVSYQPPVDPTNVQKSEGKGYLRHF